MLGAGALLVIKGELTVGGMIAANVLMSRCLQPIDAIVGSWTRLAIGPQGLRIAGVLCCATIPSGRPA
jgi:ATP-binding cassette subfamily C exporter for protease/lipase